MSIHVPPIPNTAAALIAATIARLATRLDLAVEEFPDRPEDYSLLHPLGAVLVRYKGSLYGATLDTGVTVQERKPVIELTLLTRSLNGEGGAVLLLETLRRAVAGWQPPAFDKCAIVRDEFLDQQGGLWRHALDFATKTLAIEDLEPEPMIAPAVADILIVDGDGNEKVHLQRP